MKYEDLKKYINQDVLIIFLVHIFFTNILGILLLILPFIMSLISNTDEIDYIFGKSPLKYIVVFIFMCCWEFVPISFFVSLLITYELIYKKTKHENVKNFITNLKNNYNFQIKTLIILFLISIIPPIAIYIIPSIVQNYVFGINNVHYMKGAKELLTQLFYRGWFVSYLVLFLYWDIKKKITSYKGVRND